MLDGEAGAPPSLAALGVLLLYNQTLCPAAINACFSLPSHTRVCFFLRRCCRVCAWGARMYNAQTCQDAGLGKNEDGCVFLVARRWS